MTPEEFTAVLHYLKSANLVLILVLIAVALWPTVFRRGKKAFGSTIKRGVFYPLLAGFSLWAVAYGLDLGIGIQLAIAGELKAVINLLVTTAFVWAGSTLLRLERRIHQDLPAPSPRGLDHTPHMRWIVRWLGHRLMVPVFFAFGAVLLVIGLLTPWEGLNLINFYDVVTSFLGLLILGLGMMRELNRTRLDITGVVTSGALLFYAVSQLLVYYRWAQLPLYTIGILSKGILFMGMVSFFALGRENKYAYRDAYRSAHRDFSDKILTLLAHHRSARHTIFNATSQQGFILKELARLTPDEAHGHLQRIGETAKKIETQAQQLLSLSDAEVLFERRQVSELLRDVKSELDGLHNCSIRAQPPQPADFPVFADILREALHRIVENAAKAGARTILLSACADEDRHILSVENDGPPITPAVQRQLFNTRRGGFWVARRIAVNLGGQLTLAHSTADSTRFDFTLPRDEGAN